MSSRYRYAVFINLYGKSDCWSVSSEDWYDLGHVSLSMTEMCLFTNFNPPNAAVYRPSFRELITYEEVSMAEQSM